LHDSGSVWVALGEAMGQNDKGNTKGNTTLHIMEVDDVQPCGRMSMFGSIVRLIAVALTPFSTASKIPLNGLASKGRMS